VAIVYLSANLRPLAGGRDRVQASGATLRQVFDALDAEYPGLKEQIVEEDRIRPQLAVAVNGSVVEGGMVVPIDEDAEIFLIPAIGGGVGTEPAVWRTSRAAPKSGHAKGRQCSV
jgi:molybdopterin converting factor small subunit